MKLTMLEFDGTPAEFDATPTIAALFDRLDNPTVGRVATESPRAGTDLDVDPSMSGRGDTAGASTIEPHAVPGVAPDGQPVVHDQLTKNPAADLFEQFLARTSSWPNVIVLGIKIKGAAPGTPLDYSRYLRVRKSGSHLGAFAYVWPADGIVNLRLSYDTDDELAMVAPDARRTSKGHQAYRVTVRVVDRSTLDQALELARLAYDGT